MKRLLAILICMLGLALPAAAQPTTGAPAPSADERYEDAIRLYDEGQVDAAIYLLQQVEKDDPSNTRVLLKLGEMAIAQKNWAYAIEVLRKASKVQPDDVDTRLLLMDVYRAYQMPIQEIMVGREVLTISPKHVEALRKLAFLYHDQDMVEDEIATRETLMAAASDDFENMRDLAHLYWKTGNTWEQALVLREISRRFPERKQERLELAGAYMGSLDWFNALDTMDVAARRGGSAPLQMFREAARSYRQELQLRNVLDGEAGYERDIAPQFRTDRTSFAAVYDQPFLRANFDLGVRLGYSNLTYAGTDQAIGSRGVAATHLQLRTTQWWNAGRTRLHLNAGLSSVAVSGALVSRSGTPLAVDDFPFTENRKYGGDIINGLADFHHHFTPRLGLRVWLGRELMDDIDAQVRLITKSTGGAAVAYTWPDLSSAALQYEQWYISDHNTFSNVRLTLDRILLGEQAVHDFRGHRTGFVNKPPRTYLAIRYQGDWLNTARDSVFYQTYPGEVEHQGFLTGEVALGKHLFFRGQGLYGVGSKVLKSRYGGTVGFGWKDVDEVNEVFLQYGLIYEDVIQGTQANPVLEGASTTSTIQLNARWHF